MKPANNSIKLKLYQVIDESLALLKQSSISEQKPTVLNIPIPSLLDQCLELCEQHQEQSQEPLRTVHHFGLPLDSPLLSSLATIANTHVLTDIHPNNNSFKDSNKSQTLVVKNITANNQTESSSEDEEYRIKVFLKDLQKTQQQSNQIGQRLLICDNHCLSQKSKKNTSDLLTLLNRQFAVRSLILLTDPVDSYPVYCTQTHIDIPPLSFEEYCQTVLDFIQENSELAVIRHDDFVAEPERGMVEICEILGLPVCEDFMVLEEVFVKDKKTVVLPQIFTHNNDRQEDRKINVIYRRFKKELKHHLNINLNSEKSIEGKLGKQKKASALPKPVVRIIHHLSCTGGTLFSKCLAAQPSVVLLNEVDPFSKILLDKGDKPKFDPRDLISLMNQEGKTFDDDFIATIFCRNIEDIVENISTTKQILILREHTHGAYLLGSEVRDPPLLDDILKKSFVVKSILTVRNPIDSYLSLQEFGWLHFEPPTFDEYCFRYLCFLDDYKEVNTFKYEDFVEDSMTNMNKICTELDIKYDADFINHFSEYKLSGDSGRSGDVIEPRERRKYNQEFVKEVNESDNFKLLALLLGYESII